MHTIASIITLAMIIVGVWGFMLIKRGLNPFVSIATLLVGVLAVFGLVRKAKAAKAAKPAQSASQQPAPYVITNVQPTTPEPNYAQPRI